MALHTWKFILLTRSFALFRTAQALPVSFGKRLHLCAYRISNELPLFFWNALEISHRATASKITFT